jgi:hypothetical protein
LPIAGGLTLKAHGEPLARTSGITAIVEHLPLRISL